MVDKKWSDFKIGWIPIVLKSFVIGLALLLNFVIRKTVCPFVRVCLTDPFRTSKAVH